MNIAPLDESPSDSQGRYERALTMLHTNRGNPLALIDQVLADHPGCVAAHCLRAATLVMAGNRGAQSTVAASVTALESAGPSASERERRHAAAARAWLEADPIRALELYGAIVVDWPRDILALTVAHALDFRLGRRRMLRLSTSLSQYPRTTEGPHSLSPTFTTLCDDVSDDSAYVLAPRIFTLPSFSSSFLRDAARVLSTRRSLALSRFLRFSARCVRRVVR